MIRRYERTQPGELVHIDVKKLAGCAMAVATASMAAMQPAPDRDQHRARRGWAGYDYVHAAVDDHSRLADARS